MVAWQQKLKLDIFIFLLPDSALESWLKDRSSLKAAPPPPPPQIEKYRKAGTPLLQWLAWEELNVITLSGILLQFYSVIPGIVVENSHN